MTCPGKVLFLLYVSLLQLGCNDDYKGLKNDFSIRKIYYLDSVDRYTVGDGGVSFVYTIDLEQDSLSHKQLLTMDSFVQKVVYPAITKNKYKRIYVNFYRESTGFRKNNPLRWSDLNNFDPEPLAHEFVQYELNKEKDTGVLEKDFYKYQPSYSILSEKIPLKLR
jgi:hypothetical protein